ncbi:MAG TPA: Nramp family divalent metal transporter [Microlunatus sp.]|nr:Nramp family divalent metal transporter [Microlunatus sp.]
MHQRQLPRAGLRTLALACMAAIAYVDPGNFAVNVAAGAKHGYTLVWVVVGASVTASLVQYLAAKLGIATGMSLAENCRARYGRGLRLLLWFQAELVVIMTDLAELVGGAFALYLLFGIPMVWGALIVAGFGFVVLALRIRGYEGFRPVLLVLFGLIVVLLVAELFLAGVDGPALVAGLVPRPLDGSAALLAVGIIGATVMPHALHFHSAVAREDSRPQEVAKVAAVRRSRHAIAIAMSCAAVANVSLVLIAARLPAEASGGLTEAYAAIGEVLGQVAAVGFGVALLASGLSSTIVGIYTGQVVMQGFWRRPISLWLRRLLAVVPPLVILMLGIDPSTALVLSQVVLSFGLPASLIPLVLLTSQRRVMGRLVNAPVTVVLAVLATSVICALDVYLLVDLFSG